MIIPILRKLLSLDKNDREIEQIKSKARKEIGEATIILGKVDKMQRVMVKKTTTYYIAQASGLLH